MKLRMLEHPETEGGSENLYYYYFLFPSNWYFGRWMAIKELFAQIFEFFLLFLISLDEEFYKLLRTYLRSVSIQFYLGAHILCDAPKWSGRTKHKSQGKLKRVKHFHKNNK